MEFEMICKIQIQIQIFIDYLTYILSFDNTEVFIN